MKFPTIPSSDREAILRRAVIRAIPAYYAWPKTERERYRLSVPREQYLLIRQAVLRSLFDIEVSTEVEMNEVLEGFDDEEATLQVYIQRETRGLEPHIKFVFPHKSALDEVRFSHFFSHCQRIAGDFAEVAAVTEQEQHAASAFMQAQYSDIQQNFDPSVVPLRKKRKIVLADGALDGLS